MDMKFSAKGLGVLVWLFLVLASATGVAYGQAPDPSSGGEQTLPYNEAEAYAIDQMIMCPVCPAETIDQAQVPIARQMRQVVREMLAEGATREEILDFFAQRYGQGILASPPKSGFNLVAWVFPLAGVVAALVTGTLVLRAMSKGKSASTTTTPEASLINDELEPYLAMVDRQLTLEQSDRESTAPEDGPRPGSEGGRTSGITRTT
jgi:cytochrome c-type biogenesis protein CcmH